MIDSCDNFFSQNPEENETLSLELKNRDSFWRWFIYLSLLFLGGGLSYGWFFLTQKLIPLLEKPVSNYISRPVKLGKIEAVSLTRIRLGETRIETTDKENDSVIAEGVEISFNPLQLLGKNLDFGITVINSDVYLQQDKDNSWLNLKLNKDTHKVLFWYFNVNNIQVRNSNLIVKNKYQYKFNELPPSLTQLKIPSANIYFEENQSLFEVKGNFIQGGNLLVSGLHQLKENEWLLKINSEDLATNTINNLMILPVNVNSGKVTGNIALQFSHDILKDIRGEVSFNQVNFKLPNLSDELKGSQGKVTFHNQEIKLENINTNLGLINTQVNGFIDKNRILNIQANTIKPIEIKNVLSSLDINHQNLITKGKVTGKIDILGDIHNPKIKATIVNSGITEVDKIPFDKVTANLEIYNHQLSINNLSLLPTIGGEVSATGKINLLRKKDDSFTINWQGKNIEGEKLASIYHQELPINVGLISGNYNLSGNWRQFNQAKLSGFSTVELAGGKASIKNLEIDNETWRGEVRLSGVKLTELPNIDCEKIGCNDSLLNGEFQVSGKNQKIDARNIELLGNFDVNFGGRKVNLDNTKISQGNWQTLITAENLLVSQLPSINLTSLPITGGKVSANLDVKGNLTNNDEIKIQGKGKLDLPEGRITISNFTLAKDNFIADTNTVNFPLDKMGKNLRGEVTGKVTARGNINNLTPEKVNLDGDLVFSQGMSVIKQPISANFSWNGENLRLNQGISDGIQVKGIINYDIKTETVKNIDLDIIGFGIDLQNLSLPSSLDILNYQGKLDFRGNLQGNFLQPQLKGNLTLNNFQLVNLAFSPLQGEITFAVNEGLNFQLNSANEAEKFSLQLDEKNQPQLIDLQIQETKVKAIKNDETLGINVDNIPLEKITKTWLSNFPADVKKIGGNLSGDVNLDLNNYNFTAANITIEKPTVNHLQGDKLIIQLSGEEGIIKIEEGKLNHQNNEYLFAGELQPFGENPQLKAKVEIKEGDIQNLLNSWQIFELRDISKGLQPRQYGNAKDLYSLTPNNNGEEKSVSSSALTNDEEKSVSSSALTNGEEKIFPSSALTNGEEKIFPSSALTNGEEKSVSSSALTNGEEKIFPSSALTNSEENIFSFPASLSNSEEKTLSSPSLSNGEEKIFSSPSLSNSEEKTLSSPALTNSEEKILPSSPSLSNSEEKILPSSSLSNSEEKILPSSSLSNSEEKSVSSSALSNGEKKSVSSSALSNSEEKILPSSDLSNSEEKIFSSPSLSNSEEKILPSSPSLSNGEEKSVSSSALTNSEEKTLSSPSLSNSEEKIFSSPALSNSEEKIFSSPALTNSEEKIFSSPALTNIEEKTLSSPSLSNSEEKTLSSPSLSNSEEKILPSSDFSNSEEKSLPSSDFSNSEEKILPSSPSLSNSEEKTLSSSSLSNSEEKTLSSSSLSNSEEKIFSSPSLSNSEEKILPSSPSLSNSEEKSVSSSALTNGEEKSVSSPALSNSEEKTLSSPSLSNSEEKILPSPASLSNSQSKPLASIQGNDNSLLDTLTFFRKVEAQLKQVEANRLNSNLPSLENLQGKVKGSVDINLSFQEGIKAEFDFRGDDWLWGKYQGKSLQATGSYDNGLLTLLPVKIESNNSILSLTGTFQPERISGEVKLSDFSISQLKEVANLPNLLDIGGVINASIAISGSEEKPLAKGNIEINNSSINGTKIEKTSASFGFRNSRLDFLANSNLTENTQPLTLIGSLPFQLFPNSILPDNNNFLVSLNLTEDGFNLLDIITNNQLNWLEGEGDINLDIKGKYSQNRNQITDIDTQGIAILKNGVIGGKILPDNPITNINGQVFFNFDQLNIPNLTGNFSGGNITIAGGLPLINNRFSDNSLNITVDDLALNINSLYLGNAQGFINIANSVIAPQIGGKIKLYNGEIKVTEKSNNNNENLNNNNFLNTNFNNLQLILGNNITINQPPLLNLKAEGSLNINGELNNLKPEGIIALKGGNLNLFTSQLKLANNYNNIAKFTIENGFKPYLDIQLEGSVTETLRYQLAENSNPNEIRDIPNSSLNNAQTIKIKANVKGWSNNLKNNIQLSSSPQRNQTEIIALLGGGFFNNFGESDGNLGLANLASAAFLGSVQGQLQKEFGFDQLRLFPTQIFNTKNRTSSFALGAELGLNITDNFSVSITKILTNEQAPSYNIRYRLNDQTILRGSSDFEQDSRGIIEFQHRF